MLINSYAVLLAFIAFIRLVLGVFLTVQGVRIWREVRGARPDFVRSGVSDRYYLLALSALLLLTLNLVSWPLFYALLQSYVNEIPGVMCIYGVTRVGEGSLGRARYLPTLTSLLQWSKPILVFIGGSWYHVHVLNRRLATDSLLNRLSLLSLPFGIVSIADAAFELAYLALPKVGESASTGCCTADHVGDRYLPTGFLGPGEHIELSILFFVGTAALTLALYGLARHRSLWSSWRVVTVLFIGAVAVTCIAGVFLVDVAAPWLLVLPFHHCPYDLPMRVPESIVTIALYVTGSFCVGWVWTTRLLGMHPSNSVLIGEKLTSLTRLAVWCYCVSIAMLLFEMLLT